MTTRIIAAVDPNWVIGVNGGMPWHFKADFKRFKERTMGGTLIMGKTTWESLPKPLPGRRMMVLTRQDKPTSKHPDGSCEFYGSIDTILLAAGSDQHGTNGDVWIVGGAEVYKLFLDNGGVDIDEIDLTFVPEVTEFPEPGKITYFPVPINLLGGFKLSSEEVNVDDTRLRHCIYKRAV